MTGFLGHLQIGTVSCARVFALAAMASTAWTPAALANEFPATLQITGLADGQSGFLLRGSNSVASAGDVNGDGFDDIVLGLAGTDYGGYDAGSSYVIFGKASGFPAKFDLATLDGKNGFRVDGATAGSFSGLKVSSAGDINGDSFDDVVIGTNISEGYVVFGKASGFSPVLKLARLNGRNGFRDRKSVV